ncbi:MAG: acyltransferase [Lachnospiraceae bacterium]|nr:acyltransferase [Lachnospiraceae bacterium]
MQPKAFHDNHFESIQTLRGIAALFVVLEHVRFLSCGAFGVDIFFCISGFMIMFSTHKSTEGFLRKRLIRIVPLYYLMTIGTFGLLLLFPSMFEQTTANPMYLVKSLLFIPFDIGGGVIQPLLRIGWTVNCEMFFYVLFLIALHISHKYRGLICSILLGGIVLLAQLLPTDFAPLTFYGNPVMLEFVMGIFLYYVIRGIYHLHCRKPLPRILLPLCLVVFLGLFVLLPVSKPYINVLGFHRLYLWGLPAMILVLCAFIIGLFLTMPRFSVGLGNMSYSLYLIHYYPVMLLDRVVFDFSSCTPFSLLGVAVSILLCLVAAYICWNIMEKKFTGWLKKRLKL